MDAQKTQRLAQLANQLASTLMTAAICADEIRTEIREELDGAGPYVGRPDRVIPPLGHLSRRPLLDESTLSVHWDGKCLHLGHTRAFRLLDRLARRPNQYVTHTDLLRDVWDDEDMADATIRSVVRHLRSRLRAAGMAELASAIRGHNGRYILELPFA